MSKLKEAYNNLANEYLLAFADLVDVDPSLAIWEDGPGGIASVGGFVNISYSNIRYAVDKKLNRDQISQWYNKPHTGINDFKNFARFRRKRSN